MGIAGEDRLPGIGGLEDNRLLCGSFGMEGKRGVVKYTLRQNENVPRLGIFGCALEVRGGLQQDFSCRTPAGHHEQEEKGQRSHHEKFGRFSGRFADAPQRVDGSRQSTSTPPVSRKSNSQRRFGGGGRELGEQC